MNIIGTVQLGLIYSLLALGIYISFRIMNVPDLTADGSFTLGLCASTMAAVAGSPALGLFAGFFSGGLAGIVTGVLQTFCGINPILAGILTMTGLYSVNVAVLRGSPNVSLIGKPNIFADTQEFLPFLGKNGSRLALIIIILLVSLVILAWFFRTGLGLRIRATGNNEKMVRASSINPTVTTITAIAISNAFIGLSGAVLAQYQGYADIHVGTGIVIVGLASVIIGEAFIRGGSLFAGLCAAALGALVYRFLVAFVLYFNFMPAYTFRLLSAVIVAAALAIPKVKGAFRARRS